MYRELGDETGIAWTLNNLGLIAYDGGAYARARALHEESYQRHQAHGSAFGAATALYDLANALHAGGEHERARAAYREALSLLRDVGDQAMIAFCVEGLARVALTEGRPGDTARLSAAAAARRAAIQAPLPPPDRPRDVRTRDPARVGLGEGGRTAAWGEGQQLPLDQAIRDALGEGVD